jgi:hypothetical protein
MIGKNENNLDDVLESEEIKILSSIFKIRIGKILSFDPEVQVAKIELVNKPFLETETKQIIELESIVLPEVPLATFVGAWGNVTTPIGENDFVIVYFADRDFTDWLLTGETRRSASTRMHDKNVCFFTPCTLLPNNQKIANYNNNGFQIEKNNCGKIALDTIIRLLHNSGGIIEIDDKIKIANATQNLNTILTTLIDILTGLKVLNPITGLFDLTIDPVNINDLNNVKSNIETLLK